MSTLDTALLDTLLAGLSDRNAPTCILRKAQQAAYAPEQYTKNIRTSLFPTHLDLPSTVRSTDLWKECGLPVTDEKKDPLVAVEANYLDLKKSLIQIIATQKLAIEQVDLPNDYTYADASDYCLLQNAMNDLLTLIDTITSNPELKELAFEFTTGVTTPPPHLIASLQTLRSKLERLTRFKEALNICRMATTDLKAVLENVPRLEPLTIPLPDSNAS
ncbi:Hypothetical protein GLP15_4050 [Giardia lamblia P15]|uniref:Uncharacterized protein n=1 Tax=Giardia intestinalis (strain P15) TaxID=658858 RepID=E1F5G5_GIAIA|nr:Hypothetical protein GLP15_4050 [Giardia lamblia P15]